MKKIVFLGVLLAGAGVGEAMAQCSSVPGANINQGDIATAFGNKLVCAQSATEKWAEDHVGTSSGPLFKRARGSLDPVDPRRQVGTWAVTGSGSGARIVYNYTGGSSFTWSIQRPDGPGSTRYLFCNGATQIAVTTLQISPIPADTVPNPCP